MLLLKLKVFSLCLVLLVGCTVKNNYWKDRAVVRVDKYSLTSEEFAQRLARKLKIYDALSAKDESIVNRAKNEIVEEFIVEMITLIWAQKRGLFVRKEALDKAVNEIKFTYPDTLSFKRALANEGLSFNEWRTKIRFKLLQEMVFAEIVKGVKLTDEDSVSEYYKKHKGKFQRPAQVKLRQILLESKYNAGRILKEIQRGISFDTLAKKYSIAPEADKGGIIGWIEKGTLAIYDKAFNMGNGQRSPILKSPYGFHIFEVMDKRSKKQMSLSESQDEIKKTLLEERQQQAYSSWVEEQLRATKVFKDSNLISAIEVRTND